MSALTVYAPGKAIVCGEYAVLDGAPAICVAVDRYVTARAATVGEAVQVSPFVDAALRHARAALSGNQAAIADLREAGVLVDSAPLYERVGGGTTKIGLGSSAAVTAAVVGLAFRVAGETLEDRARLFAIADAAHAEAQGMAGSGIDVATSIYGGAIHFQRRGGTPTIRPVVWPKNLRLSFVFAGESASTTALVGRVKALAARDATTYQSRMAALAALAERFADDVARHDVVAAIATAAAWQPTLASLGHAADAPIVTPVFERLAAIAARHHAASKPSGAGGGDLAVLLSHADHTAALEHALTAAGLHPISLVPNGPVQGLHPGKTP